MCPHCQVPDAKIVRCGYFSRRTGHARRVQRLRCASCQRRFSTQTGSLTYRERKPHVTMPLCRLLVQGVSQASAAYVFGIHPTTVARKIVRLGRQAALRLAEDAPQRAMAEVVVFDEMETFEHSKCKPVSIALAVVEGTRHIVAAEVARMPAKGKLAAISRRRYGHRADDRPAALRTMLKRVRDACPQLAELKSDQSPRYPTYVREVIPQVQHTAFKGRRGCVVGQGELKAGGRDPLFSLNHTCAMFRDRLKRLSRRTWCTTKRVDRLQALVHIYAWSHNERLRGAGRLLTLSVAAKDQLTR